MSASRTERLLNLLIALLNTRYGLRRGELREKVDHDTSSSESTFSRMFERDKSDLRQFGFEVETVMDKGWGSDDPATARYRIGKESNRLPDVNLSSAECTVLLLAAQLWEQARADALATGAKGLDFEPLLAGQRKYIEKSDLAVCHQETPVSGPTGPFSAYPSFNVPPQIITAAQQVGYQACTTASNHTIDQGTAGLVRTLDALDAAGLQHTGSYRSEADSRGVMILNTAAATVAVIEGAYGLNGQAPEHAWQVDMLDPAAMIAKARKARALGADIVLGVMHAGDEYANVPNEQQRTVAHALVDSGQFTMIYGHHTHSVLPIERYKGTWIVYGLGNGVTELSPWYVVNNEGLLVRAQFSQDAAGKWSASDLAWAPSVIVRGPYRWCSVASDAPQGPCAGAAADAATRLRTRTVVESMGAAAAGAHELLITKER